MTKITSADGHTRQRTDDARGNQLTETDEMEHTWTRTYDGLEARTFHKMRALCLPRLIEPARFLRLDCGTLSVGAIADITLIDPDLEWTVDRECSASKSRSTPPSTARS